LKTGGITEADDHLFLLKKNSDWIRRPQKSEIVFNACTVHERGDMQWLLENGFQFITTNEQELLLPIWRPTDAARK
jgi:glycerophosphoryl diester phosphodiesterase